MASNSNNQRNTVMAGSNKKKTAPPVLKKKEIKTKPRLFRFTESNYGHLKFLADRYKGDISAIADLLIEASKDPGFLVLLDKFVTEKYANG